MSWIKRNLFFVIGSVVALALLGWAGYYNFSRWQLNVTARAELNKQYEELNRLNNLPLHPGKGNVDNIDGARKQKAMLTNVVLRAAGQFQPIPSIPSPGELSSKDFAAALRQTIARLQRESASASVLLPPDYSFSFFVQRSALTFAPGSLEPLAVQLGEVKAICDIFNKAKVNSLDGIRRERVSADDQRGPQTDYLELNSQTNELAVISPYEVSFRCFTPELANVLAQFASSPQGFIVSSLAVEPAAASTGTEMPGMLQNREEEGIPSRYATPQGRYGGYGGYGALPAPVPPPAGRGGLQAFVNERQLRVIMLIRVVKLLPKQQ